MTEESINNKGQKTIYWERVLFRKFHHPDNYCDEAKFLNLMKKNGNFMIHFLNLIFILS